MRHSFKVREDSLQEQFFASRAKIQFYGGGFANGKTSGACIKALQLAKDYPGSNGLIARSTYPRLIDTVMKEFVKWCPKNWIKSFPKTPVPTLTLNNGSVINFRHMSQQGKNQESTTSNLLSATYDWALVDQIEDPEIKEKDFNDLIGRMRGSTPYRGDDETMPKTGPRWIIITSNPTRNWVYKKIVKPVHDLKKGLHNDNLIVDVRTGKVVVEIFEGSTYENKENLDDDYIMLLESTYQGQMKERFLLGNWGAYEGLVHPAYDDTIHLVPHADVETYYNQQRYGNGVGIIEGYDYGIVSPSCHLFGFSDMFGNVLFMDGFYKVEYSIEDQAAHIKDTWLRYSCEPTGHPERLNYPLRADPQIFRRTTGGKKTVGQATSDLFAEEDIIMVRGNNDIINGITKVNGYLIVQKFRRHPLYGTAGSPHLFFSDKLAFMDAEFSEYYWNRNTAGEFEDKPVDRNDHGMNALKYALSDRPEIRVLIKPQLQTSPLYMKWAEYDTLQRDKSYRYR